jgi:hypothetical protein
MQWEYQYSACNKDLFVKNIGLKEEQISNYLRMDSKRKLKITITLNIILWNLIMISSFNQILYILL